MLSIHGIQIFGFNDLGQQLVAGGRGEDRQKDECGVQGEAEGTPPGRHPPYRMGIMAIMMRGKIIFM